MVTSRTGTLLGRFSGVLVVALLVPLPGLGPATGTYAASPLQARAVTPRAPVLAQPLGFEPNASQTGRGVTFLLHGSGYALALLPNGLLFTLTYPSADRSRMADPRAASVQLTLLGANPRPEMRGLDVQAGRVNYLLGNDPGRWRTQVPTFGRVRYHDLYRGIDLLVSSEQSRLSYDFVLAPGVDPGAIRLRVRGARAALDSAGDLLLFSAAGDLRQPAPLIYQQGRDGRVPVAGHYRLAADGTLGFTLAHYDRRLPLVIDPYVKLFGTGTNASGPAQDLGAAIALDSAGDAYITGAATDGFPTTPGVVQKSGPRSLTDAFVLKLNPAGKEVYATYLGGSATDAGTSIAVDGSGNVYVTGRTSSSDFPLANALDHTNTNGPNGSKVFVAKLNAAGSRLLFSTFLGGSKDAQGTGIAIDGARNIYVTGFTYGTQNPQATPFPTTRGAHHATCYPGYDAFVSKLNPAGTKLLYSTCVGGKGNDFATGIAIDAAGDAVICGYTEGYIPGSQIVSAGAQTKAFIIRLDPRGQRLLSTFFIAGHGDNKAYAIALDGKGDAFITGSTTAPDFPVTVGAYAVRLRNPRSSGPLSAIFLTAINAKATRLLYSALLGGNTDDTAYGIALDQKGDAWITGTVGNTLDESATIVIFPTTPGANARFRGGTVEAGDVFLSEFNPTGATLLYSTLLGGPMADAGLGITVNRAGRPYLTGYMTTQNPSFPEAHNQQAFVIAR